MRSREEGRVPLSQGCFPELQPGGGFHKLTSQSVPAAVQNLEHGRVARPAQRRCATEPDASGVPGGVGGSAKY